MKKFADDNPRTSLTVKGKAKKAFDLVLHQAPVSGIEIYSQNNLLLYLTQLFDASANNGMLLRLDKLKYAKVTYPGKQKMIGIRKKTRDRFRLCKARANVLGFKIKADWHMILMLCDLWNMCRHNGKLVPFKS